METLRLNLTVVTTVPGILGTTTEQTQERAFIFGAEHESDLSPVERSTLARWHADTARWGGHAGLRVSSEDWRSEVLPALRSNLSRLAAEYVKDDAEYAELLAAWREKAASEIVMGGRGETTAHRYYLRFPTGREGSFHGEPLPPGVQERMPELIAERDRRIAAALAREKAAAEAAAAAEALAAREKAAAGAQFREFALGVDSIARAAKEGYDINAAVIDELVRRVCEVRPGSAAKSPLVIREGTTAWDLYDWDTRKSPSQHAFAVLDRIASHVATVERPECVELYVQDSDVPRVLHITRSESQKYADDGESFTGVVVWISSPLTKDRVVIFRAE
jgi:hypothetical protein